MAIRRDDQPTAPYLDAVVAHGFRGSLRFHVPGHKGGAADAGFRSAVGRPALALDLPADLEGIDLGPYPTPYQRAEELAAEAYGAKQSWFLTNGATQGNHALCLALAALGTEVAVQRNCHASIIDGLVLSGGCPIYLTPEYDEGLGMAHGVTAETLAEVLDANPDIRFAFIVSPTYYGMAADVKGCVEVSHSRGVALVVDQAWGPHFGFHSALPASALVLGADAVLTSTHKIVGSLTQSAILHVGDSELVDASSIARMVRLTRSTSPSSLLMASLDSARRQLAIHGEALLSDTLIRAANTATAINAIPGCSIVGEEHVGRAGVAGFDPMRIVIDVRDTGHTGYELAEELRANFDIHLELATRATLVLILGIAEPQNTLERFVHNLRNTIARFQASGDQPAKAIRAPSFKHSKLGATPRDAFLGVTESVPVYEAVGRVSAETIAGYPPGIPSLLPGEFITQEVIDYLVLLSTVGARLHGASDPEFRTVCVMRG